jgi:hypothetical protein
VLLFEPLTALLYRYADRLNMLAHKIGATGFSIGVNVPVGFSLALNFDFPSVVAPRDR